MAEYSKLYEKFFFVPGFIPLSKGNTQIGYLWLFSSCIGCIAVIPGFIIWGIYLYKYCKPEILKLLRGDIKKQDIVSYFSELYDIHNKKITEYQDKITEYQERKIEKNYDLAIEKANQNNFKQAIKLLTKIPASHDLYEKSQQKIKEYSDTYGDLLINDAIELAEEYQYLKAIDFLKDVPVVSSVYNDANSKITLYTRENEFYNDILSAEESAKSHDYELALLALESIPNDSLLFSKAESLIDDFKQQQFEFEELRKQRTVESSGRRVEIVNLFILNSISSPGLEPIYGTILAVKVFLSNSSKKEGNFQHSTFELKDGDDCTYNEITDFTYTSWRKDNGYQMRADNYYPGETREDIICFRVSPAASDFTLIWKGHKVKLWI